MHEIREVEYNIQNNTVVLGDSKIIKVGKNVRLGNYYKDELIYSEGYEPIGIQPYKTDLGTFSQTKGSIYLGDDKIIEPWDDFEVVGRPTYYDGYVFFETRRGPAPASWEVWRHELSSGWKSKILDGANPYCYNGKIFYSSLNGNVFETKVRDLADFKFGSCCSFDTKTGLKSFLKQTTCQKAIAAQTDAYNLGIAPKIISQKDKYSFYSEIADTSYFEIRRGLYHIKDKEVPFFDKDGKFINYNQQMLEAYPEFCKKVTSVLSKYGIPCDFHPLNCGHINGKMVYLDFSEKSA